MGSEVIMESNTSDIPGKKGISGSTLKLIAIVSMLVDHIGATIVERKLLADPSNFDAMGYCVNTPYVRLYYIMRIIGRLAFPIFIYLLIQGFKYTRNRWKYIGRLALFSLISEIPFDMAFNLERSMVLSGHIIDFTYQNVFWTLTIGLLTITFVDKFRNLKFNANGVFLHFILELFVVLVGMTLAFGMKTDYGAFGVLAIYIAYCADRMKAGERKIRSLQILVICLVLAATSILELFALLDIWPVCKYNGRRGIHLKWVFYIFYPVHLLILACLCIAMGI